MKYKMLAIIGVVILLFGTLYFAVQYKNNQAIEHSGNPYNKDQLHQATIDQLDDPFYQNQITPEALDEKLANEENVTVYFYSPLCVYCERTTPILVPLAESLDIDLKKLNLLEFNEDEIWDAYEIEGTPTVVHYKNGEEVARIDGQRTEEVFELFFEQFVLQ